MRSVAAALLALLVLATSGCGARFEVLGVRVGDECPVVARPLSTLVVPEEQGSVLLYVTNQSFEDPVVAMTVAVDGAPVVDQELDVCGQHEWVSFPLAVAPGWHDLEVTTGSGASNSSKVEVPDPPGKRSVVVSYWVDPDPRVDVEVHGEPVGFG